MTQQISPWLEGAYGWNFGESGWNTGMDQNLLKFSFMFDRNVDSVVASLPAAVNGQAHYLTTDNRLYFAVGTTYFSTPVPKWFTVVIRSTGDLHQYNGTSLVQIDGPTQVDSRLDAVELTVANLGTAAFEDIEFFATQAGLDIVEATASAYTDLIRTDLADTSDVLKGAGQVGRASVAVNSIVDLLVAKQDASQHISVRGYHAGRNIGGMSFYWDSTRSKTEHNAGTIIDPARTFPSDWTNATQITNWYTAAVSGTGCWVAFRETTGVNVDCFGAFADDETYDLANYTAIRTAIKFAILPNGPGTGMFRLECQEEVSFGSGNYWVIGRSLFCFNHSEMEALPGNYRFRRGIRYRGQGRDGTIITLKNTGLHTWFYDTADGAFPGDTSVWDQVEFSGMTLRSYDHARKYVVTENSKISGFRMETYGWEKFFNFKDVRFEGFDRAIQYSGNGNADHNSFYGCQFIGIKDSVFFINNNQSVQTRLYGCDFELIYGNCFEVYINGGGDVKMYGGSVILQPRYLNTNLPDLTNTTPRAFLNVFQEGGSSGVGYGNNLFTFHDLRFEMYDDFQKAIYAIKDTTNPGGSIDASFTRCSFHSDFNRDAVDAVITPAAASKSLVVFNNNLRCTAQFSQCQLIKRNTYVINGATSVFAPSRVMFDRCDLEWDPLADTSDGGLYTKCTASNNGAFVATGCTTVGNIGASDEKSRVVIDFQKGVETASGGLAYHSVSAQVKSKAVKWPVPADTKLRLYLPEGSIIIGVTINKPAFTPVGTPATNYGLVLQDNASATIFATGTGSEERAILANTTLGTPKVIPAAPNNFVQLTAVGSGLTQTQNTAGTIQVHYS